VKGDIKGGWGCRGEGDDGIKRRGGFKLRRGREIAGAAVVGYNIRGNCGQQRQAASSKQQNSSCQAAPCRLVTPKTNTLKDIFGSNSK
jgi:hypothetical protein